MPRRGNAALVYLEFGGFHQERHPRKCRSLRLGRHSSRGRRHGRPLCSNDTYDNLQVDFKIFLFLFQCLCEEAKDGGTPGKLIQDSQTMIRSAPNQITETYALQLWNSLPDTKDLVKYGVVHGSEEKPGRGIKRPLEEINHLRDHFQSLVISDRDQDTPPSIRHDNEGLNRSP